MENSQINLVLTSEEIEVLRFGLNVAVTQLTNFDYDSWLKDIALMKSIKFKLDKAMKGL